MACISNPSHINLNFVRSNIRSRRVPTIPTPTRTNSLHSSYQYISFIYREPHQGIQSYSFTIYNFHTLWSQIKICPIWINADQTTFFHAIDWISATFASTIYLPDWASWWICLIDAKHCCYRMQLSSMLHVIFLNVLYR